jgi:hypothetical protein
MIGSEVAAKTRSLATPRRWPTTQPARMATRQGPGVLIEPVAAVLIHNVGQQVLDAGHDLSA